MLRFGRTLWGRMDYAGTATFLGCDCIVLRVRGAFDEVETGGGLLTMFTSDAATFAPLGWQDYDDQGYMIQELALADLKPSAGRQGPDEGPLCLCPRTIR